VRKYYLKEQSRGLRPAKGKDATQEFNRFVLDSGIVQGEDKVWTFLTGDVVNDRKSDRD
jgi:hypothetical protein